MRGKNFGHKVIEYCHFNGKYCMNNDLKAGYSDLKIFNALFEPSCEKTSNVVSEQV